MSVLAVIQARTGSTRLPGKVLMQLQGKPVLEHVVRRVQAAAQVSAVIVATTDRPEDEPIAALAVDLGITAFRGSENDVLDRFYQAALLSRPQTLVRITADCPLMDPALIDAVITLHRARGADYTSNVQKETYPDGEDIEVFSFAALEKAWLEARLTSEREHVTPYIRKHPELFRLAGLENGEDLSGLRWTLDNPEDFDFISSVYARLYARNPRFGMDDVLALLREYPELRRLNAHIDRNEGYQKSLRDDAKAAAALSQDQIWLNSESDRWFERNRAILEKRPDQILYLAGLLGIRPARALEIGCANGYRLAALHEKLGADVTGVEPSNEAISDGKARWPFIRFVRGMAESFEVEGDFDLVVVNFVFHWIARENLFESVARIDRAVKPGGILMIGDFGTEGWLRRGYHHLDKGLVHTFKQQYQDIFKASGLYREIALFRYNHDTGELSTDITTDTMATVSILKKQELYREEA